MKKIFLILLFPFILNAQSELLTLFTDDNPYSKEATQYFDRLADLPSPDTLALMAALIDSMVSNGLWAKIDECGLLANKTLANGLTGMKGLVNSLAVGSPSFTPYQGVTSASGKYLDLVYVPSTNGVNYTQNSASLGAYILTSTAAGYDMGAKTNATNTFGTFISKFTDNKFYVAVNDVALRSAANAGTSQGMFIANRTASNSYKLWKNSSAVVTATAASSGVPAHKFVLGAYNLNGTITEPTTRQYAFWFVGAGLTDGEISILTTIIERYMDAIGIGVIP